MSMRSSDRPAMSMTSQFLFWGAGFAAIFTLLTVIAVLTGERFEIAGQGASSGVPLPHRWLDAGVLSATAVALWLASNRWDRPAFVAFRGRHPWVVPTVATLVVVPGVVMLLFVLVQ